MASFAVSYSAARSGPYASVAALTMWIADYLATFPMEVHVIWSNPSKSMGTTLLFFVGRYFLFFAMLLGVWDIAPGAASNTACLYVGHFINSTALMASTSTSVMFLLRAYAVCAQSRLVLLIGMVIVAGQVALALHGNVFMSRTIPGTSTYGVPALQRCTNVLSTSQDLVLFRKEQIAIPSLSLALETFVFVLVVYQTLGQAIQMRKLGQFGISQVILRDGILYFAAVLVIGVLSVVASVAINNGASDPSLVSQYLINIMVQLFNVIPNVLINRLVLSLRTYSMQGPSPTIGDIGSDALRAVSFAHNDASGYVCTPSRREDFDLVEEEDEELGFANGRDHSSITA